MNERQKKIMVPYQEPTDICPDCSEHPCDCGLPAGYQSDIRFAANFAPHIKVIEATKVAEIIKERDDLLRYNQAFRQDTLICADCDAISKKEYDQAIEQRDRLIEVIKAASVLIAAKGRHNTMLAYNGLRDALQSINQNIQGQGHLAAAQGVANKEDVNNG